MSEVGLLNSKASITPFSSAGMISPPGSCVTLAPISWNRSAARPTVRYFRPFSSEAWVMGFLNQPSGCVGIGIAKKPTTLRLSLASSSL